MIKKTFNLLQHGLAKVGIKLANRGVIDFAAAAHKEQYVFVVGRFQRIADDLVDLGSAAGCDRNQAQGESGVYVLRILAERCQGLAAKIGQFRFVISDAADTAGCHEAAVLEDSVEQDEHFSIGTIRDQMAFKHVWAPVNAVLLCEGFETALMAKALF